MDLIGRPILNTQVYVLDGGMRPVPVGGVGELYIGGAGVARGYLNRADLTLERFVANPFASAEHEARGYTRLYKSGDLVRWSTDGNLIYLGRNDAQVKIRGHRIELGEVESALRALAEVSQAVVIDRVRGDQSYLAAYVVTSEQTGEGHAFDGAALRQSLSERLPSYMVPASVQEIAAIPLTINGKLDRRALPEPDWDDAEAYVAPRTALEAQLCSLWGAVLGRERVGIEDNFFQTGGDSITAVKLGATIQRELGLSFPLTQLFQTPSIAGLASWLSSHGAAAQVIPALDQSRYPLSFAQERLWFLEQYEQGTSAYHIPLVTGLSADMDVDLLERALQQMVARHAVLRTVYRVDESGDAYQEVLERAFVLSRETVLAVDLEDRITQVVTTPFDLSAEMALRGHLYETGQGSEQARVLVLVWHHIAFDGWSTDLFQSELSRIYGALVAGETPDLPDLPIQYGDYAQWQRGYLQGDVKASLLSYWEDMLSGYETLALPVDHARPARIDYSGATQSFSLDADLSAALRQQARAQGTTLNTVLLMCVDDCAVAAEWSGRYCGGDALGEPGGSPASGCDWFLCEQFGDPGSC